MNWEDHLLLAKLSPNTETFPENSSRHSNKSNHFYLMLGDWMVDFLTIILKRAFTWTTSCVAALPTLPTTSSLETQSRGSCRHLIWNGTKRSKFRLHFFLAATLAWSKFCWAQEATSQPWRAEIVAGSVERSLPTAEICGSYLTTLTQTLTVENLLNRYRWKCFTSNFFLR